VCNIIVDGIKENITEILARKQEENICKFLKMND
jgi:hypothetical protein